MATALQFSQRDKVEKSSSKFKERITSTGARLYLLERKVMVADHAESMRVLDRSGLEPLDLRIILPILLKNRDLTEEIKGCSFNLRNVGINQENANSVDVRGELKDRVRFTMDAEGNFIKLDKKVPSDEAIKIFNSDDKLPLILYVYSDKNASDYGARFYVFGNLEPWAGNNLIMGVPKGTQSNELLRN